MPEHVYLPLQKFKELVDYTKRTQDIITGFIKKKSKHERTQEPPQELTKIEHGKTQRKRKTTSQKPHAKPKKPRTVQEKHEVESEITDTANITNEVSSDNSESESGSEEDAFWFGTILYKSG